MKHLLKVHLLIESLRRVYKKHPMTNVMCKWLLNSEYFVVVKEQISDNDDLNVVKLASDFWKIDEDIIYKTPPYSSTYVEFQQDGDIVGNLVKYDRDTGLIYIYTFVHVSKRGWVPLMAVGIINIKKPIDINEVHIPFVKDAMNKFRYARWSMEEPNLNYLVTFFDIDTRNPLLDEDSDKFVGYHHRILSHFFTYLNTTNIGCYEHCPSRLMNRGRIGKRTKVPLFTYKTLRIMKKGEKRKTITLKPGKQAPSNEVRVHLCRGHVKTYTKERPLFGKLVGKWYWAPQARGDKSKGIVVKDYEVT